MIRVAPVVFNGGLNLASTVLELKDGEATQLFNYEVNTLGRYQRVMGFERFDGQPSPSSVRPQDLSGHPFETDTEQDAAVLDEQARRRQAIKSIDGSGRIRGIAQYQSHVYAFRDSADGKQCCMYKSSSNGWQKVTTPFLYPQGRYEFVLANFGASSETIKLYGVDGKNPLFSFDGERFEQIEGPIKHKYPTHLEVLSSQVMVNSYEGGTFVFSAVGDPTDFLNGGEIGCGDDITALDLQANNALAVFCRNRTYVLYGTSKADFQLQDLSKTTGAIQGSVQTIGDSIYIDDRGMTRLNRVQQFGNFDMATISQKVEPLLARYAKRIVSSFVVKEKNQYRACFDDGTGLICTFFGSEVAGFSTFDYGKTVRCTFSGEDEAGGEVIYFGSDDGYVYQAERGFTFDGLAVSHVLRPSFTALQAVDYKKRWRKAVIEIDAISDVEMYCIPDFDYSDPSLPAHPPMVINAQGAGGYWDEGAWDETRWSAASTFTSDIYIDGISRNISVTFSGQALNEAPFIINSMIIHYSPRGRRR